MREVKSEEEEVECECGSGLVRICVGGEECAGVARPAWRPARVVRVVQSFMVDTLAA